MFLNTTKNLDLPVGFEKGAKILGVSSQRATKPHFLAEIGTAQIPGARELGREQDVGHIFRRGA